MAAVLGFSTKSKHPHADLVAGGPAPREQSISLQVKQLFLLHCSNAASLRAQYGTEMPFNAVHGSRDREDANRELDLLFPSFKFSDKDTKAPQGKLSRPISLFNLR